MGEIFLRLDDMNFDTEWEYLIFNKEFSMEEVLDLFLAEKITSEEYKYASEELVG